nr:MULTISPECIES: autotransporter outer membrane beta-barrel domain-containing protein [unclassified Herbaspirillum]
MGLSLAWDALTNPSGNFTLNNGNFNVDQVLGNRADGGNDLVKSGTGTLTLSANNIYTGSTTVNAGGLVLSGAGNISNSSALIINGGTVDVSGVNGNSTLINNLSGAAGSTVTLGNTALTINNIVDTSFAGNIQGTGTLIKSGAASFAIVGTSSLGNIGAVVINQGTLDVSGVSSGSTLINNLSGVAGSTVTLGSTALTVNNTVDTAYAGDIHGTGTLTKTGAAALTLTGNMAYTGETILTAGKLILDGSAGGAQLSGDVIGQPGSSLALINGARLTGSIDPVNSSIDASSTWNMTAPSVVANMALAGIINFAAPPQPMTTGRTLTASNWTGQGGTVNLYAVLSNNASVIDQIVINGGTASGNTNLHIINIGGQGAQTTGSGIKVVDTINNASTSATAFTLAGPLYAGAYQYNLQRGSGDSSQDWFLVSKVRAETSLYSSIDNQGARYASVVAGSLIERMGALTALERKTEPYAWGRLFRLTDDQAASSRSVGQQADISGVQVGSDVLVEASDARRDSVGVYFASGQSVANVNGYGGSDSGQTVTGQNTIHGYSLGAYLTRLESDGGYLDMVFQTTWYEVSEASVNHLTASTRGLGVLGSAEIGQAFDLGDGRKLELQGQLGLQSVKLRGFALDAETDVSMDARINVASRLGLRLSKTELPDQHGNDAVVWLGLDLLNNSGPASTTHFITSNTSDVEFSNKLPGTRVAISAGADGQISKNLMVNVRVNAETSIDASHSKSYGLQVGIKLAF